MGRPFRVEYPGIVYHINSRGNENRVSGSDQANSLIFKTIWANGTNGKYFGALNPLFHGGNQACKKYLALPIHKIRFATMASVPCVRGEVVAQFAIIALVRPNAINLSSLAVV
jgi:hypothetical protein